MRHDEFQHFQQMERGHEKRDGKGHQRGEDKAV